MSDNQSRPPTTPNLSTDEWQRQNIGKQDRLAKGLRKIMSEVVGVLEVAKVYCEIGDRDPLWSYEYRPDDLAKTLAAVSAKLRMAAEEMK